MTTVFVTEVGEVSPDRKCVCGDAAELHEVTSTDPLPPKLGDPEETPTQYYDKCAVQGCQCTCYEEAQSALAT